MKEFPRQIRARTVVLKAYYQLTKPGIIYGNSLNVAAGFFLAASIRRQLDPWLFLAVIAGSALVIAGGCVYNNYLDRGLDRAMTRTRKRALVTGQITAGSACVFGGILVTGGLLLLSAYTNQATALLGVAGFVSYVLLYGLAKRTTPHGTLIGSISGAIPPLAGYTAVTGRLDSAALILFALLVAWQMPHFYAIAMYRQDDYRAAGLPVWPIKKGLRSTVIQIVAYTAIFTLAASLLTVYGYTGYCYLAGVLLLGITWFRKAAAGLRAPDTAAWARGVFTFSLVVTLGMAMLLSVGALLP